MSVKSIGIVRKLDNLGRIVLPIELRRTLGIESRDSIEISIDGDSIILKKYVPEPVKRGREKRCVCEICRREFDVVSD